MRVENAQNGAAGNVTPSFRLESIYNQGAIGKNEILYIQRLRLVEDMYLLPRALANWTNKFCL